MTWVISLAVVTPLINFVKFEPEQGKCWLDWENGGDDMTGCQPLSNVTLVKGSIVFSSLDWKPLYDQKQAVN